MSSDDRWIWSGPTDIAGETVAVEQVGESFFVDFWDHEHYVELVGPLDEAGWLHLVSSRFCGGQIP